MRMVEIMPEHVRAWVVRLSGEGVSPKTIRNNRAILSAIFSTALNDQVTFLHPCKGVKTPTVPVRPRTIITPGQFELLYQALPDTAARLLAETAIESGLRWGELSELRVRDLGLRTGILTVSRAVVEVNPKFHPEQGRFLVKEYPKDREWRRFKLSPQIARKLQAHVTNCSLGRDELLFAFTRDDAVASEPVAVSVLERFELTTPNDQGRQYGHGTLSGYSAGKCRCPTCRSAYATYRARRRAASIDQPRGNRSLDTDGHIPANWFRRQIWQTAVQAADLGIRVRVHDLRHAHASWLLAGGADLQVVKERLGHGSIATTEKYLHTLPEADETALDASRIRGRATEDPVQRRQRDTGSVSAMGYAAVRPYTVPDTLDELTGPARGIVELPGHPGLGAAPGVQPGRLQRLAAALHAGHQREHARGGSASIPQRPGPHAAVARPGPAAAGARAVGEQVRQPRPCGVSGRLSRAPRPSRAACWFRSRLRTCGRLCRPFRQAAGDRHALRPVRQGRARRRYPQQGAGRYEHRTSRARGRCRRRQNGSTVHPR